MLQTKPVGSSLKAVEMNAPKTRPNQPQAVEVEEGFALFDLFGGHPSNHATEAGFASVPRAGNPEGFGPVQWSLVGISSCHLQATKNIKNGSRSRFLPGFLA